MKKSSLMCALLLSFGLVLPAAATGDEGLDALAGDWEMVTDFQGQQIPATMSLTLADGKLTGVWKSQGGEMEMKDLAFKDGTLTFSRAMGDSGQILSFSGKIEDGEVSGQWSTPGGGTLACKGKKKGAGEGS